MVRTDKLKGIIAEKGKSQKNVADYLGISDKTFYLKMKKGVFGSDDIYKMIEFLDIENPVDIFFAKE